jgi:ZIP family zinc transporter
MILTLIAILAFVTTFFGGLLALKFKDKLHLVLGFSAGALIGVAFFDLLPESIELAGSKYGVSTITSIVALGFVVFMIIDRFIAPHHHSEEHCANKNHRGRLGAGSLSIHSFLDGIAIGLSFQVSVAVGIIVTVAVLVHDFSDGINTVGLILKNGGTKKEATKWLLVDASAPVIGIIISAFFTLSESTLGIMLATFCGFFLYIGASDLLPESHHQHPTIWTTLMTILGVVVLYGAITLAGI